MGKINVDYDVLNQKGSPAWYSDLFANIPTPGYTGRMFISTDTFAFYRDNGTGWDLTGGPGIGTITGSGVSGQVSFFSGTQVLGGSTNLIWDNTNNRLGIGVASPTVTLEISGSVKATALVKSGGTSAQILLADGTTTPTSTFQAAITLTTTGTTGASTLVGATLNVPTYTFVSSVSALTLGTSGTDLTSSVANSTTTPVITLNVPTASASNRGALSSADWTTFNNKQATITLTTTGTSGAATLVGATLNVPNYTNVGTVTSVAALTLGTSGTDLSSSVANSTSTPVITLNVPTASATNRGALSSADWSTFNSKQATISVTAPVVLTGATISMPAATTSVNGYLTSTDWNTFNNKSNTNGTVTSVVALTIGTSGIDITSTAVTTTTTPVITLNIPTASATNRGALSSTDWTIFNNKQATLSLTTTGTSGAATLVANTLNVPNYTNSATVTSVGLSSATSGVTIGSTPITTSGTITIAIATATTSQNGLLSSTDWTTFNNKQATLSLTTTGTSGVATLVANTLNVPNYGSALSGYLPLTGGTLTGPLSINYGGGQFTLLRTSFNTFSFGTGTAGSISGLVISDNTAGTNPLVIAQTTGTATFSIASGIYTAVDIKSPNTSVYYRLTPTGGDSYVLGSGVAQTDDFCIRNDTRSTNYLKFIGGASGGAATFSSSLTAVSGLFKGVGAGVFNAQLTLENTTSASALIVFTNTANGFSFGFSSVGTGGQRFSFFNGAPTEIAYITSTGAGVFSSYLELSSYIQLNGTTPIIFTSGYSQPVRIDGSSVQLNTQSGGNVLINTTTSITALTIGGSKSTIYGINLGDEASGFPSVSRYIGIGNSNGSIALNSGFSGVEFGGPTSADEGYLAFHTHDNGVDSGEKMRITKTGIINAKSRGNFLNSTDNALFSLNSGGTLYTVGFSPTATASSTNTFTITNGTTTWIYTGSGAATWTLPNPSGNNQIYWIKNAGTGAITLTAFSGTNIINNSAASVSTISIAVGATAVIAQDGNVKSYQLQ